MGSVTYFSNPEDLNARVSQHGDVFIMEEKSGSYLNAELFPALMSPVIAIPGGHSHPDIKTFTDFMANRGKVIYVSGKYEENNEISSMFSICDDIVMNGADTGFVTLITGPNFSGKTAELTKLLNKDKNSILIRHDLMEYTEKYRRVVKTKKLMDVYHAAAMVESIGIENGHLFDDLGEFCSHLKARGRRVYVDALVSTCNEREAFPAIQSCPIDHVIFCKILCQKCQQRFASFSSTSPNDDMCTFESVCRNCFFNL